jgi:hypothetical protein
VVDRSWVDKDSAVGPLVDGVNNWFIPPLGVSYTRRYHNGYSGPFVTTVGVPGFWVPGASGYFLDRGPNGQTLRNLLARTTQSDLVLIEGISDLPENAGLYRGARSCPPGTSGQGLCNGYPLPNPAQQCWPHPNFYLNVVRQYTAPFARFVIYEAEAADRFLTFNSAGSGLYRRGDPLDISYTDATQSQWAVKLNPGEWLEFLSFELGASNYRLAIRYAAASEASGRLLVDGVEAASFQLPATGGDATYGVYPFPVQFAVASGLHDVRLALDSGSARIDQWSLDGF